MIYPKVDVLLEHVDSKYALVIAAAKRAGQINDYHHPLRRGQLRGLRTTADRVAVEELPDHGAGGNRRGQAGGLDLGRQRGLEMVDRYLSRAWPLRQV